MNKARREEIKAIADDIADAALRRDSMDTHPQSAKVADKLVVVTRQFDKVKLTAYVNGTDVFVMEMDAHQMAHLIEELANQLRRSI